MLLATNIFKTVPAMLSFLVLGAHFFRSGNYGIALMSIICVPLLFNRKPAISTAMQLALIAGCLEWAMTVFKIWQVRTSMGEPWQRAAFILLSVATFTGASAWLLRKRWLPENSIIAGSEKSFELELEKPCTGSIEMSPTALAIGWAGSFIGILILALINSAFLSRTDNLLLLVGSFGASAVLLFGAPAAPLSQPRNLVGGHVISALVGVTTYLLLGWNIPLAAATAVATAITVMQLTGTLHPPGGATALIAVIGNERVHELGYLYALAPIGLGAMILLVVALITNNSTRRSKYPIKWI